MAAVQPLPNSAFVKVETDWTSNWNVASPSYTDVTGDLRLSDGLSWDRGRNDEYQTVTPGRCGFTLNNRARAYDPASNTNIVPARPVKVTCYYPTIATAYQQGQFQAEDFTPTWTPDGDAIVLVDCVERWGGLAFTKIVSSGFIATTNSATRLGQLADAAGWPAAARSFLTGTNPLDTATIQNTDVLSAMQDTANTQVQVLYQDRSGVLTTVNRFAATSSSIGTFGDQNRQNGLGTELCYVSVADGVGGGYWYTQVQVTATGPLWVQGQPNTVSVNVGGIYTITKYGTRVLSLELAPMQKGNAQSVAGSLATSLASQAAYRIKSATIRPMADPANIFPVVLNADLGNTVTFKLTPTGGGGSRVTLTGKIRSIRHEITDSDWLVTWNLSP